MCVCVYIFLKYIYFSYINSLLPQSLSIEMAFHIQKRDFQKHIHFIRK